MQNACSIVDRARMESSVGYHQIYEGALRKSVREHSNIVGICADSARRLVGAEQHCEWNSLER
jgi:hypothetical protein